MALKRIRLVKKSYAAKVNTKNLKRLSKKSGVKVKAK